jgi:general L-amino acid transport system permease protein
VTASVAIRASKPPPWRDVRVIAWTFQIAVVVIVIAVGAWLWGNYQDTIRARNIPGSFDFLDQPANFPIAASDFRQTQPVSDAFIIGLFNTLRLAVTGIILSTVLGTLLGIARLSQNFIVRKAAQAYVEFVRNVPLYCLLFLMYTAVVLGVLPDPRGGGSWDLSPVAVLNTRGIGVIWFEGGNWRFVGVVLAAVLALAVVAHVRKIHSEKTGAPARTALWGLAAALIVGAIVWFVLGLGITTPSISGLRIEGGILLTSAYTASLLALVIYTSSHIAEIVRGSIQAVPKGQGEAANALALSGFQRMWFVVLPQAMRVGVPAIGNQYLNLAKNSSLAAAISFPELTAITGLTVANRSPAVPSYALLLLCYLAISLVLSLIVNAANRRLAIVER